jgi:hypothetical protein
MTDLINNIIPISWFMLTFGWIMHTLALMRRVERKRQVSTSLWWFIKNRHRKFIAMVISPPVFGFLEYIAVYPPSLDLTTTQGRVLLVGYFIAIIMTGAGSNHIIDKFGTKNVLENIEDDDDDFKTIRR